MDIWQHIIRPGDVWGRFTLYLKQNGQAAVQREVVRSLRLRVRDVVLDLGGGGRALAQLALYSGAVYGVAATAAAVSAATVRNRHDVARGRIRICRGAFPALPFPAEMFHVITAFEPRSGQAICPPACARSGVCCVPAASACWCARMDGKTAAPHRPGIRWTSSTPWQTGPGCCACRPCVCGAKVVWSCTGCSLPATCAAPCRWTCSRRAGPRPARGNARRICWGKGKALIAAADARKAPSSLTAKVCSRLRSSPVREGPIPPRSHPFPGALFQMSAGPAAGPSLEICSDVVYLIEIIC